MSNNTGAGFRENAVQALKYLLFSASAGIIEVVTFTALDVFTQLSYWPCYLTALILSVLWNFTLNRSFTFKSAANIPLAMLKIACYYAVFTPLSTWWGDRLTTLGWNGYIVLAGTMVINFLTEFTVYRFIVFRNQINTKKPRGAE